MLVAEIRCVVGIAVAKQAHMVCALQAPSGTVVRTPSRIAATADGHAHLWGWLASWGGPTTILLGMEATGPLWEPLDDALTQAGYTVLLRESAPDGVVGHQRGAACQVPRPTSWMRTRWPAAC